MHEALASTREEQHNGELEEDPFFCMLQVWKALHIEEEPAPAPTA